MRLGTLVDLLDETLDLDAYRSTDPSQNGLQVGNRDASIGHVGLAVDAALATIDDARDAGVDLLLVHHGLLWGAPIELTGVLYDRIAALIDGDIALYAAHLPLDGDERFGNAAVIAKELDVAAVSPLARRHEPPIGVLADLDTPAPVSRIAANLADVLECAPTDIHAFGAEQDEIDRVAIVTGSGTGYLEVAAEHGADVLVTGEGKHEAVHTARELNMAVLLGGHYATETGGVRAVGSLLEERGLDTTFFDHPTGL